MRRALTVEEIQFIAGCLQAAGWDDNGIGEELMDVFARAESAVIILREKDLRDA